MKILAKTKPTNITLKDHAELVEKLSIYIAKLNNPNIDKHLLSEIGKGGYCHDIGKAELGFQNYIQKGIKTKGNFFSHQEIGWAFLKNYTDLSDMVLNVVYWHHGVSRNNWKSRNRFSLEKRESVGELLKNIDISLMEDFYKTKYGKIVNNNAERTLLPYYFDSQMNEDDVSKLLFMRYCIISADRLASEFGNDFKKITKKIDSIILSQKYKIDECPKEFGNDTRFNFQKKIVKQSTRNTLFKGPCGFGKTMSGLMWGAESDLKNLWVCPRNDIAKSVYRSILEELEKTGNKHVTVELYLTGKVQESNSDREEFTSDIVVTNIDNFLSPTCDNLNSDKLYLINNCDVIFDEFHELITKSPLLELFIQINRMRNRYCSKDARTLFLTATPSLLLDYISDDITHLPSEEKHLPTIHNKNYYFQVKDFKDIENKINKNDSHLIVFNAIQNAQDFYDGSSLLCHGNYTPEDRKDIMDNIYKIYDKKSPRRSDKINLIGTPIVQASLDLSYRNLSEASLSPEATLQRLGRCDRWKNAKKQSKRSDYRKQSNIITFTYKNTSNSRIIDILYDTNLNKKWTEYLKNIQGRITLEEFYNHYNKFNIDNKKSIWGMIDRMRLESNLNMQNIYPKKTNNTFKFDVDTTPVYDANGNKKRNTNYSIFFTVKRKGTNDWVETPFSVEIYDMKKWDKQFKESPNVLNYIIKEQLLLSKKKMFNFGNKYQIRKQTLDTVRSKAVKSDTPYLRFDYEYDKERGLIKIK